MPGSVHRASLIAYVNHVGGLADLLNFRPACALLLAVVTLRATAGGAVGTDPVLQSLPRTTPTADPMLVVVDLVSQKLVAYRSGEPVAASPVSSGKPGHNTPRGVFTILQKKSFHRSNLYSNAPMPFMQRLTWDGVALHAGALPGYPASHGCIRLPHAFARQFFAQTRPGMTVMVVGGRSPARPRPVTGPAWWRPGLATRGPVTIVVSGSDKRMIVLRDGVQIGSAPAAFDGVVERAQAYVLRADRGWTRVTLPGDRVIPRIPFAAPDAGDAGSDPFQRGLATVVGPGAMLLVVPESLAAGVGALPEPRRLSGEAEMIEQWLADDGVIGGR